MVDHDGVLELVLGIDPNVLSTFPLYKFFIGVVLGDFRSDVFDLYTVVEVVLTIVVTVELALES